MTIPNALDIQFQAQNELAILSAIIQLFLPLGLCLSVSLTQFPTLSFFLNFSPLTDIQTVSVQ